MTLTDALAREILAARWPDGSMIDRLSSRTAGMIAEKLVAGGWVHGNAPGVIVLDAAGAKRIDDAVVRGGFDNTPEDQALAELLEWAAEQ